MVKHAITSRYVGGAGAAEVAILSYDELMEGLVGWVGAAAACHFNVATTDPRKALARERRGRPMRLGSCRLYFQGRLMGAMMAAGHSDAPDYDEQDLAQLNAIAGQTAVALANAWLSDEHSPTQGVQ